MQNLYRGVSYLKIGKTQVELAGFLVFFILYLLIFNLFFRLRGGDSPIFVPGTLLFSLLGYWLGGYLYDRYLK